MGLLDGGYVGGSELGFNGLQLEIVLGVGGGALSGRKYSLHVALGVAYLVGGAPLGLQLFVQLGDALIVGSDYILY